MTGIPSESEEQQTLFKWASLNVARCPELKLLHHIPNEGLRHPATGKRLRAEGLKKGVPDICLPVARGGYHGLYIEMKRIKGSTVSEEQKQWLGALRDQGYSAVICRGWEEAKNTIEQYLRLRGK